MKKKKPFKSPLGNMVANNFPTDKKKILEIISDPKKMQAVLELGKAASKLQENISTSNSLEEWSEKVLLLLPNDMTEDDKIDFAEKFMEFVNEYRNKSERNDSTDCS